MEGLVCIVPIWIIASFAVGSLGQDRKIGFGGAFLAPLVISPLLGILFVLASEKVKKETFLSGEARKFAIDGEKHYKSQNYKEAIQSYQQVLTLQPNAPNINFQLARLFSITNELEQSFKHLTLAVEQGFKNFAALQASSDFAALRETAQFKQYVQNGYKLPQATSQEGNMVTQLEKLASLKEKGFLTDEEYQLQKKKLLGG